MAWGDAVVASVAIAFLFGGIAAITIAVMKVAQTKVAADKSIEHDLMVRNLAEEATVAQRRTAEEMTEIRLTLVDLRDRVGSMEKMLRDVG